MAETRFIKTVTFGGYDKAEVEKKLEYCYAKLYELKNELRETKLTLEEYKKGTDVEKASETILAGERAKLTQVQVQNETMSDKLKIAEEDGKEKDKKIKELSEKNKALEDELSEAKNKLTALEADGAAAALSAVFIEAQKSASLLVENSKKEAAELEENSKKTAEDTITDANNKAMKIIYDAEKEAAVISADAKNKSEQMSAASNNMRAILLDEIESYSKQMKQMRKLFADFEKDGRKMLDGSLDLLGKTKNQLNNDGVPVFREPKHYEPEMPKEPEYKKLSPSKEEEQKKKKANSELEKLAAMASAIGGGKPKKAAKTEAPAGGGIDLAALAAQAAALGGGKPDEKKSDGAIDLAALAAQAAALDK